MNSIKAANRLFWTANVPGIDNRVTREMAGSSEFYRIVDEVRYEQEPYVRDFLAELAKPHSTLLEIGCGLGSDLRSFSKKGLQVTGLDYSPQNAFLANRGLEVNGLEGAALAGDGELLPFSDNAFDIGYSYGCLHHTPNTKKAIDEIHRVVRPGGDVMVMLYHKGYQYIYICLCYIFGLRWLKSSLRDYISRKYDRAPLSQMFSRSELESLFDKFENVTVRIVTFGGIQFHPILKYVWKILQVFPGLMKWFGSFAVITCRKESDL